MRKFSLKDPKYRTPVIILAVAALCAFLWYQRFFLPTQQSIAALEKSYKAKQDELNMIRALKPQLNVLKAEIAVAQAKLDSLKSIFPDQKEIPKLLKEITGVSSASGIYTTRFNPLPDIEKDYYVENRYNISVVGGYHQLADFYSFLANFPLIINLSSVSISYNTQMEDSRQECEDQGTPLPSVMASFDMTTFSSKR